MDLEAGNAQLAQGATRHRACSFRGVALARGGAPDPVPDLPLRGIRKAGMESNRADKRLTVALPDE